MLCPKCNASVTEGKRFCADCGAPLEDPELTRLARPARQVAPTAPHEGQEQIVFVVRPTLLFVKVGYLLAALGGIALAFLFAWLPPLLLGVEIAWYIWLPLSLALLLFPAYRHFQRNLVRYTLTETKIEIDQGFIARTTRNIPLSKVQDVTVTSGLFQRLLGYGDLVIDNANANANEPGGKIILDNIRDPRHHADLLMRQLRNRNILSIIRGAVPPNVRRSPTNY